MFLLKGYKLYLFRLIVVNSYSLLWLASASNRLRVMIGDTKYILEVALWIKS